MSSLLASIEKAATKLRRKRISKALFLSHNGVVQTGPFEGLVLTGNANTSSGNLGAKIFGLYEQEVLRELVEMGPYSDVVNIGAADGYFALGVLRGKLAERSICFEITEKGRKELVKNATANGLADKIVVLGEANDKAFDQIVELGFNPKQGLVFCDIEGAEFTVLSENFLHDFEGATFIVELHDRLMPEGTALRDALIDRLPKSAKHRIIKGQPPDWQGIPEIEALSDNDRALACSDGRKIIGEWLIVTYDT